MKHMLLIYEPESAYEGEAGRTTLADTLAKHVRLAEELAAAGIEWSGLELSPTSAAATVRTGAGGDKTVHDGPFAETREQLGGYYLIDVADLDAAKAWAARIPVVPGGKVEVRPVGGH